MVTVGSERIMHYRARCGDEKALRLAGMKPHDIDLWEINEALASVVMQTIARSKSIPICQRQCGAIALGHPLGATGAMFARHGTRRT